MTMGPAGPPRPSFEEALGDLLSTYADLDIEQIIADMEMHLEALCDDLAIKAEIEDK